MVRPVHGEGGSYIEGLTAIGSHHSDGWTGDGEGSIARISVFRIAGARDPDRVITPQGRGCGNRHAVGSGSAGTDRNTREGFQGSSPLDHFDVHR